MLDGGNAESVASLLIVIPCSPHKDKMRSRTNVTVFNNFTPL